MIAEALTRGSSEEAAPEIVGHHFAAAGLDEQAVPHLLAAGEAALRRMALPEAVSHLTTALDLNSSAQPSPARDRYELSILTPLSAAYLPLIGWTAPEYAKTVRGAVALAKKLDDPELAAPAMWGIWLVHGVRCEFDEARKWIDEMLAMGEEHPSSALEIIGHASASLTHNWMGEFAVAREHWQYVHDLYDRERHAHVVGFANHDPKCATSAWASHFLWILRYPDQAANASDEQLALAREIGHPVNLAFALVEGSGAYVYRRESSVLRERRDEALAMAQEQGLPVVEAVSTLVWICETELNEDHPEQAYRSAKDALDWWHAAAAEACSAYMKAIMAAALGRTEGPAAGLAMIEDSLANAERTGDCWHLADAHRIKGDLHKLAGDNAAAEAVYRRAMDIARAQMAKGWELRAATSLARLWQSQGKTQDANDVLQPVYDWFAEGLDTADLIEAKALLDELG